MDLNHVVGFLAYVPVLNFIVNQQILRKHRPNAKTFERHSLENDHKGVWLEFAEVTFEILFVVGINGLGIHRFQPLVNLFGYRVPRDPQDLWVGE